MADLLIDPQEESEQETVFGTIFLRVVAVFLCSLLGVFLVLLGYMSAILMNLDLTEFSANASTYFIVSLVLWSMAGLFTPFTLFERLLENFKGVTFGRVIVFIFMTGTFIILHWYALTVVTALLVPLFGTE